MRHTFGIVAIAAISLAALAPLKAATPAAPGAQERSAFSREENAFLYKVRIASGEVDRREAARELARFYFDRELFVEALAALETSRSGADDDEARLMTARAQYALHRFHATLGTLSDERVKDLREAAAWRAMAFAELGAFESALAEFARAEPPAKAGSRFAVQYHLLWSSALQATGDAASARAALDRAREAGAANADIALAEASLDLGREARARETLRELGRSADARVAALAELRLISEDARAGAISHKRARAGLEALRFKWSGTAFEREWLTALAATIPDKDVPARIDALRRLADEHPESDAARNARPRIADALRVLLADEKRDARQVAELFYASVDYVPRGAEGDAMVRGLADRLARLDLLGEAGRLLEHQVFKRLRGAEKSAVAADLAQIYLGDRRPSEALRVLRATRVAGVDAATLERRRLLEATALERVGQLDAALELLGNADSGAPLALRAEIEWRAQRWREAAASYRAMLGAASAPLKEQEKDALLRAGAAYVLAGDSDSFASLRAESAERFGEFPEHALLSRMPLDGSDGGAAFLDAYKRLFGEAQG